MKKVIRHAGPIPWASYLIGVAALVAAAYIWAIPDASAWWQANRPDLALQRHETAARDAERQKEIAARDAERLKDLDVFEAAFASYAKAHHTLPTPKEYGGDDGDNWDVSTKGDFLRFLKGTLDPIPLDPINKAANDPCHDPNSYGFAYSVANTSTGNTLDRTYVICTQLEATHQPTERHRSVRQILGIAATTKPSPKATKH